MFSFEWMPDLDTPFYDRWNHPNHTHATFPLTQWSVHAHQSIGLAPLFLFQLLLTFNDCMSDAITRFRWVAVERVGLAAQGCSLLRRAFVG